MSRDDYSLPIMYFKSIVVFLLAFTLLVQGIKASGAETIPEDLNAAVVYAYFRVGDEDREIPGISLVDFQSQIDEITRVSGQYHVMSIESLLKEQEKNSPLPSRTIALTFEGSDSSFFRNAFPILEENNIPFTLFVSPGLIDQAEKLGDTSILSWDEVRKISKSNLATIGMTSYAYHHVDDKSVETLTLDINHARERFRTELQAEPAYFSYPYGETTASYLDVVSKQGFMASFGQQSGVIGRSSPRNVLPRFTVVDNFTDLDRFKMTALSLPFPVLDQEPSTTVIGVNPPHPGFTVGTDISEADLKRIKCFASGIQKVNIERIGARRFEIRFSNGFEDTKGRLNCTLPVASIDGADEPRWRWLGFLFVVPDSL